MSQPPAAAAEAGAAGAASGEDGDPQLYMQELSLQECLCTPPELLPHWKRWNKKTSAGKKKQEQ